MSGVDVVVGPPKPINVTLTTGGPPGPTGPAGPAGPAGPQGPSGVSEVVWQGPTPPTDPSIEFWYDTAYIDESFDGPAGQPLDYFGQYSALLLYPPDPLPGFDGAGNAVVIAPVPNDYGFAVHPAPLPLDCWVEVGVVIPASDWSYRLYARANNANQATAGGHLGYGVHVGRESGQFIWQVRRDDSYVTHIYTSDNPPAGEHVLRLECQGNTMRALLDGVQGITWTETGTPLIGFYSVFMSVTSATKTSWHRAGAL